MSKRRQATRPGTLHFEIMETDGKWVWTLYAPNRKPLAATAISYRRRDDVLKAIRSIVENCTKASIVIATTEADDPPDDTPTAPDVAGDAANAIADAEDREQTTELDPDDSDLDQEL